MLIGQRWALPVGLGLVAEAYETCLLSSRHGPSPNHWPELQKELREGKALLAALCGSAVTLETALLASRA